MILISKRLLLVTTLIMLFVAKISAQADNKDVKIISSGSGKTLEEAKQAALRSATEQAFGAFISSKTEMFNDQVVADQMALVSSGNIKSFEILNQDQLPDGRWGVTLQSIVSVDKLTSFVQAKGVEIEIKGGMFAMNIKQQLLNEQGEIQAVAEMVGLLHEVMQMSIDYEIKSGDPKSVDAASKEWEIPLVVTAICNKNMDFCANYLKKTLSALSLSAAEVETYTSLNKQVFPVEVTHKNQTVTYNLRKQLSINALNSFASNWNFYTRNFVILSGMDESYGNGEGKQYEFSPKSSKHHEKQRDQIHLQEQENMRRNITEKRTLDVQSRNLIEKNFAIVNFPDSGKVAGTFRWNDRRTLVQIEQMTGYTVKPRGVVSNFKNGGYVVYEKDGHGLVVSFFNIGVYNWQDANNACNDFMINGYSDWRLPSIKELQSIYETVHKAGLGNFYSDYWSNTIDKKGYEEEWYLAFSFWGGAIHCGSNCDRSIIGNVRPVRSF